MKEKKEMSDKTLSVVGTGLAITGMIIGAFGGLVSKKQQSRKIEKAVDKKVTEKFMTLLAAQQNNSEG